MTRESEFLSKLSAGVFRVEESGEVWRLKMVGRTGNYLPITPRRCDIHHRNGYYMVRLGKKRTILAHRAVFVALSGSIPDGYEINHINGIKNDNRIVNLELCTRAGNIRHSYSFLGHSCLVGSLNGSSKLTWELVDEIRAKCAIMPSTHIARQYGVSESAVRRIKIGVSWREDKRPSDRLAA